MPQHETGYEVLALSCHDTHCPTLFRDPATGLIGVQGKVSTDNGEQTEHISWMTQQEWELLRAGA